MKTLASTALLALTLAMAPDARALVLGGTFGGTAQATELPLNFTPSPPVSFFDGAPVTGSFQLYLPDTFPSSDPVFESSLGWMRITFDIKGEHFAYEASTGPAGIDGPLVGILGNPSGSGQQSVTFQTGPEPKYDGASFTLSGPIGSLFDNDDPGTLHLDPALPPTFEANFENAGHEISVSVLATLLDIEPTLTVPEPGIATLLVAGAGTLLRRRSRIGS